MKNWVKVLCSVILVVAMLFTAAGCSGGNESGGDEEGKAAAEPVVLHFGSTISTTNPLYAVVEDMAKEINERSNGEIEVVLDLAGVLGGDKEIIEMIMNGSLAMSLNADIGVYAAIPEIGYLNLPYLFEDRDQVKELYYNGWLGEAFKKTLADKGIELLGTTMENDFRWLTNSKHSVVNPEDVKGLKLRVPQNPMYIAFFEALGAQPTAMSITEVPSALQQKVIDGQDNGPIVTYSLGFHEFQPYVTKTMHAFAGSSFFASEKIMSTLTEEQQKVIREVSQEYSLIGQQAVEDSIDGIVKEMEAAGCTVVEPSDELKAAFREAAYKVWTDKEITKNFTPEVMDRILNELMIK